MRPATPPTGPAWMAKAPPLEEAEAAEPEAEDPEEDASEPVAEAEPINR